MTGHEGAVDVSVDGINVKLEKQHFGHENAPSSPRDCTARRCMAAVIEEAAAALLSQVSRLDQGIRGWLICLIRV
jgi:hypothetical protein